MFLSHTVLSREDLCKNFLLSHARKYYTAINKRTKTLVFSEDISKIIDDLNL